ncbi:hypothetical protein DERP_010617 [Dermatophagoides pteronyssinus]|uniref:Uncharacterized protein n=1 Tax=Dermatophagoides pteronyssinus TaxID=6956 RepID=A0ABQ8J9Y9_DERPT|nr:hypothetical protein DERP_010617 [Dermatophagoides pteronyssinus]
MIKFTNQMMMYQTNSSPAPLRIGRIPLKVPVIKGRVPYVTFTSTSNGQQIYSSLTDSAAASASTSLRLPHQQQQTMQNHQHNHYHHHHHRQHQHIKLIRKDQYCYKTTTTTTTMLFQQQNYQI